MPSPTPRPRTPLVPHDSDEDRPAPRFHLELHGAGPVGRAIVRLLADVDCTVRWIDERSDSPELSLPATDGLPTHIQHLPTDHAVAEVAGARPGACHLVLTHRHALDLPIVQAILARGDFAFLGMLGSPAKRARFVEQIGAQLGEAGASDADVQAALQRLVCPIGLPGIVGKAPAVIAIAAVAQLLQGRR